jgi:molybdopterin synthase sulfur carrier subunit
MVPSEMKVTVGTILHLKDLLGSRQIDIEMPAESTVLDVLREVAARMGPGAVPALLRAEDGLPQTHLRIMVNGRDIQFVSGLETRLVDGDHVVIIPPASGG